MACRFIALLGLFVASATGVADSSSTNAPRDLFLGESFYYAEQGLYFDAISRLDAELQQYHRVDERQLDPLHLVSSRRGGAAPGSPVPGSS